MVPPMRCDPHTRLHRFGCALWILIVILGTACGDNPSAGPTEATQPPPYPWTVLRPPIPPRWVFEPWIWEDDENTEAATRALVEGYLSRGIPVGAVIIDSPWQASGDSGYHSLRFDPALYPTPTEMIEDFHGRGVRSVLWITGNLTPESPLWAEACTRGFFVRRHDGAEPCPTTSFWKASGRAAHLDFFSEPARRWWGAQLDLALATGADGWKVDGTDFQLRELGERVLTAAGPKTPHEYSAAMYGFFHRFTRERLGPDRGAILARPFADDGKPAFYAPLESNPAGWVGDQEHDWQGLREALREVLVSGRAGYPVVGSDIGGLKGEPLNGELLVRWAQLGALLPLMENGGRDEHRPWRFEAEVLDVYREFARLHHALVPYFYHHAIEAHRNGSVVVQPLAGPTLPGDPESSGDWRYELGDAFLVDPIREPTERRTVRLPPGPWLEWFDLSRVHAGDETIEFDVPLDRYPLFVRAGAIIPWNADDGRTTLLVFPRGSVNRLIHLEPELSVAVTVEEHAAGIRVTLGPSQRAWTLRIHRGDGRFEEIRLDTDGAAATAELP